MNPPGLDCAPGAGAAQSGAAYAEQGGVLMKISTKGRYALRLMLDLAMSGRQDCVALKEIAARQQISIKYMEQIITILNRAGFVHSLRGPQGGYRLTRPPEGYTVGEILRLTEGGLAPVACLEVGADRCPRAAHCAALEVIRHANAPAGKNPQRLPLANLEEPSARSVTVARYLSL